MGRTHPPDVRIARHVRSLTGTRNRYFVGVYPEPQRARLHAALVRVWGEGLQAVPDLLATSRLNDKRVGSCCSISACDDSPRHGSSVSHSLRPDLELAEMIAEAVVPLRTKLAADPVHLRAVGALNCGVWVPAFAGPQSARDAPYSFLARLDTSSLAKLSELTVIDDFPGRDQAEGGRGGPCEAAGLWMMLADRGIVPGRRIRAAVDLSDTVRLYLLPPRQPVQLPPLLSCYEICPGRSLLDGIMALSTAGSTFDPLEQLAVQGRRVPELSAAWTAICPEQEQHWSPQGIAATALLEQTAQWLTGQPHRSSDALCTAIHWIGDRITRTLQERLPRSQPVGQLVLAGPLRHHRFLHRQMSQAMPAVDVTLLDEFGFGMDSWQSVAAAMLAAMTVDQVPATTYGLTGTNTPRVLGRITPGPPGNWHEVLADMAATLPDKVTLRSAI